MSLPAASESPLRILQGQLPPARRGNGGGGVRREWRRWRSATEETTDGDGRSDHHGPCLASPGWGGGACGLDRRDRLERILRPAGDRGGAPRSTTRPAMESSSPAAPLLRIEVAVGRVEWESTRSSGNPRSTPSSGLLPAPAPPCAPAHPRSERRRNSGAIPHGGE
jgi:hypothetical protein